MICISFEMHNVAILMYHSVVEVKKFVGLSILKLSYKVAFAYMFL